MPVYYCENSDVELYLPASHGFTSGQLDTFRERGARRVDSKICPIYRTPLPDIGAATPTPEAIRDPAARLSAYLAHMALAARNQLEDASMPAQLRNSALADLRDLMEKEPGDGGLPTEQVSGETMTFVDDADASFTYDEWRLVKSLYLIDPDTVQIAGAEYGRDFYVEFSRAHRGWILTRLDRDLITDTATTVSYEYSYRRNATEIRSDVAPESMRLYRG